MDFELIADYLDEVNDLEFEGISGNQQKWLKQEYGVKVNFEHAEDDNGDYVIHTTRHNYSLMCEKMDLKEAKGDIIFIVESEGDVVVTYEHACEELEDIFDIMGEE